MVGRSDQIADHTTQATSTAHANNHPISARRLRTEASLRPVRAPPPLLPVTLPSPVIQPSLNQCTDVLDRVHVLECKVRLYEDKQAELIRIANSIAAQMAVSHNMVSSLINRLYAKDLLTQEEISSLMNLGLLKVEDPPDVASESGSPSASQVVDEWRKED